MARKLAPGSLYTVADQVAMYEADRGKEAAERQVKLAKLENKQCICDPRSVKKRWGGSTKATTRRVHAVDCPRHRGWMLEVFENDG